MYEETTNEISISGFEGDKPLVNPNMFQESLDDSDEEMAQQFGY